MNTAVFTSLLAFLDQLDHQCISYTLAHQREDALMVLVAVPGERWEIEFRRDGAVEIEKFISTGEIHGAESLSELFARYADQEERPGSPEVIAPPTVTDKVA
jgi:hypothetical protein